MVWDSLQKLFSISLYRNDDADKRVRQLTALNATTQLLTSTLELEPLLHYIVEHAVKILDCEAGSLFLVDEQTQELVFKLGVGVAAGNLVGKRLAPGVGIIGRAVQARQPVIENDVQHSSDYQDEWDQKTGFLTRSLLVVPMQVKDRVIALLEVLNRRDGYPFVADDQSLLTAFAGQAAIAIENARLYQGQLQRSRIIEALASIANEIATTRDVLPVLEKITYRTAELLGTDHVAIYLLQDDSVILKPVAAYGMYRNELLSHTVEVGQGVTGNVFLNARAEIINDLQHDPRKVHVPNTAEEEKIESLISAPLILRGKTIGVIDAWRLREICLFNDSELDFLVAIAHQASICVESGRLFQDTVRQAQESETLRESLASVVTLFDLKEIVENVLDQIKLVIPYDTASVWRLDGDWLTLIVGRDLPPEMPSNYRMFLTEKNSSRPLMRGEQLYLLNNHIQETRTDFQGMHSYVNSWLAVPLKKRSKIIGQIALDGKSKGQFNIHHAELALTFADQIAIALENASLYTEIQQELSERKRAEEKVHELNLSLEKRVEERTLQLQAEKMKIERFAQDVQCLRALTNFLQACLTVEETAGIISDHMSNLFPLTSGSLFLATEGSFDLELLARWGDASTVDVLDPTTCWGLRRSRAYIRQGPDPSPQCLHYTDELPRNSMCLPLLVQGDGIGLICLERMRDENDMPFTPEIQNLAIASADSIALALANLRLREKLHNQAIRDPLTGLFNRRFMEETLEREVHRATRAHHSLSIIMFDIDNFRIYNNTYGHDAGDYVIRKLCDAVRSILRNSDFPCRGGHGADEFTIILPDTALQDAARKAEELRRSVQAMALSYNNQALGTVTISCGVASFPQHGDNCEAVLKMADAANYKAKAAGRNCVVVAE